MVPQSPPSIQQLPEKVVHKIAAGEVVERPVSVVKELVENSLDAGATRILVEVEKGGTERIRITDNGHGIEAVQMPLALKRHATSKIRSEDDLFHLNTLGFRGEALPSIASVSEFCLESATVQSAPLAYGLEMHGGKASPLRETALDRGTRITVSKLFCTTPARLKFLKRPETEWSHVADLLTALALGHPEVEWRITHNGKSFLLCPPAQAFEDRILDVFGKEAMENLYAVERKTAGIKIHGFISHPSFSKKTNRHMFVYVNGRYIQDRLVNHAIVSGYRSLLMTQQYPVVVLHLQMDPALVDVNVHPTKREVRFSNSNAVHHLVSETVRLALEKAPWRKKEEAVFFKEEGVVAAGEGVLDALPRPVYYPTPPNQETHRDGVAQALQGFAARTWPDRFAAEPPQAKIGTLGFARLKLIGQFLLTYLVCEHEGSLILIDQHAAHERIGFEKLKRSFSGNKLAQQKLLHPLTFDLPPAEAERLRSLLPQLEPFGLTVEEFGKNSFVLKAHPTLLKNCDWVSLLKDLAEKMEPEAKTKELEDRIDHVLATMACHRQIRANHRLTREEMEEMLKQLEGTPRSYHCPHGRPVMVEIEAREIEKWFKRVL